MNYLDEVRDLVECQDLSDVQTLQIVIDANQHFYDGDLEYVDLEYVDLHGAYLWGADLSNADLEGADLRGADLRHANLYSAYLHNCIMNWQSHDLISARLHEQAQTPLDYAIAMFVLNRQWCWDELIKHGRNIYGDNAVDATLVKMRAWVRDGDGAPSILTGESA